MFEADDAHQIDRMRQGWSIGEHPAPGAGLRVVPKDTHEMNQWVQPDSLCHGLFQERQTQFTDQGFKPVTVEVAFQCGLTAVRTSWILVTRVSWTDGRVRLYPLAWGNIRLDRESVSFTGQCTVEIFVVPQIRTISLTAQSCRWTAGCGGPG